MSRYSHTRTCYSDEVFENIKSSKILVIGAGGIGSELLKNLVLTGFQDVEVIDLDTIDVSNLNRQFLFRKKHVGLSKSQVAKEAVEAFNEDAKITSHHGNVKGADYNVEYYKKFDLCMLALDNVSARQHCNRIALAAKIPIIDAGSQGFLGQVSVIHKDETKCYDCDPKSENKKTYPICTIRNTPDKPVHCIVWGKELFKLMFGVMNDSMLSASEELEDDNGNSNENGENREEETETETEQQRVETRKQEEEVRSMIMSAVKRPDPEDKVAISDDNLRSYAKGVFDAVFDTEIKLKLKMRNGYKGAKKKPEPVSFDSIMNDQVVDTVKDDQSVAMADQKVWTLKECCQVFCDSVVNMWKRGNIGACEFDKDDAIALDFVTAASNLRSHVFNIERKSKFDVKGIAGNIIHAIATTNAIVAGLQVLEAIKVLRNKKQDGQKLTEGCKFTWVVREPIGSGNLLQPSTLEQPNPNCYSCGKGSITLTVDCKKFKLEELVGVLRKKLGVNAPSIMLNSSEIYLEGEGLEEDEIEFFKENLLKTLEDAPAGGIKDGSIIEIEDFSQELQFQIIIQHRDSSEFDKDSEPDNFIISGEAPKAKETNIVTEEIQTSKKRQREEDDLELIDNKKKSKIVEIL